MTSTPLIDGILKYINEDNVPLSMPGHKCGRGYKITNEGLLFLNNLIKFDITEVDGVDNLHSPENIIKESLELLSKFYESKKSYFLVNGSTSGNLAMIFSSFQEGDKVIVERNCHRSVYNGIIMRKLKPIYIKNNISEIYDAPLSIDIDNLYKTIEENQDAKGIVLTYPNYYGVCYDLKTIVNKAKSYGMKVIVDSAHGAHFKANNRLPKDALELGCDMVVESSHKTIPSLTQTAFLHVNEGVDLNIVDFYVSAFLSTSPSYILMASMEYGRFFLQEYGEKFYNELLDLCDKYTKKINKLSIFHIISEKDLDKGLTLDKTRFIINVDKGYSGHKLLYYLREKGVQCELSDCRNVVAIFSPFNTEKDFETLYNELKNCDVTILKEKNIKALECHIPNIKLYPYEVLHRKQVLKDYKKCQNKICREAVVPYPPGIPLIMPGEIIDKKSLDILQYYIDNKVTILGLENNNIAIIEE